MVALGGEITAARRAVFLDRDGVLNAAVVRDGLPYPPASVDEMSVLPGVREACKRLRDAGFLLIVVTNQPDIARGKTAGSTVGAINGALQAQLGLDEICICPHDDVDGCDCRKPRPGLLLAAARRWEIDLSESFMVGDRWRDVEAGRAAGCHTVFIDYGYAERRPSHPDIVSSSLAAAVPDIVASLRQKGIRMTPSAEALKVQVFADGADRARILELYANPLIKGFTTNPTLMRQAGISDYEAFAKDILSRISDRPFSFEVFSDDFDEMDRQARKIAAWGGNVFAKIPVTNSKGESSAALIRGLVKAGVQLNITAILTLPQVDEAVDALKGTKHSYVSVFAGRIADTGRDPMPFMRHAVEACNRAGGMEVIWASPRELLNIFQADEIGCHVITATPDIIKKLGMAGKDLGEFSLETVKMFYNDGAGAGFKL
jgi:transaldolase